MVKKLLPIIIIALIVIAFFYKIVFSDYVLVDMGALVDKLPWKGYLPQYFPEERPAYTHSDSSALYFPIFKFYGEEIKRGNFPLWCPPLVGGYPLFANSTALMLNPFTLLLMILPVVEGYSWSLILKIFLGGVGMFLYLRLLRLKPASALFGSIIYMFNGLAMSKLEIPWMTQSLWSIPFIFFFLEKIFLKRRIFLSFYAAIFLALQFVGAHPQTGMYVTAFALLYILAKLWRQRQKNKEKVRKIAFLVFLPFIFMPLLAAVQLVPMFELNSLGQRVPNEPLQWISPLHFVTLLIPQFFGNNLDNFQAIAKMERNISHLFHLDFPLITFPYLGILPLVFVIIAPLKKIRKNAYRQFFTVVILGLIILHLTIPLWTPLAEKIPLVNTMWNIYRIDVVLVFGLAILAAYGLECFREMPSFYLKTIKRILKVFFVIIGLVTLAGLLLQTQWGKTLFFRSGEYVALKFYAERDLAYYQKILKDWHFLLSQHFNLLNPTLIIPLALTLGAGIFFLIWEHKKIGKQGLLAILFLITLADLFYVGRVYNPLVTQKKDVFPMIRPLEFLVQDQSFYRVSSTQGAHVIFPNSLLAYNIADIGIEYNIYPLRYNEYMSFAEDSDKANLSHPFHTNILFTRYDSPLFDIFNVKYVFRDPRRPITREKFEMVYNDDDIKIYQNTKALPRTWIVPQVQVLANKEEILNTLRDKEFNPWQTVIFEEEPLLTGSQKLEKAEAQITKYETEEVVIKTELSDDGFLILSDSYYPGWEVYVDGIKDKIYRANYLGRGVALRAGEHNVVFKFEPMTVKIGAYISLISLLILVFFTLGWTLCSKPPKKRGKIILPRKNFINKGTPSPS